ncbi:MAG: flippase [Candidatus Gracilibacteria bacterium]|nr:flippase [Candidatus Gracilibacteria bacterium]
MSTARKILSTTAIQIAGKIMTAVLSIVIIKYITSLESIPGLEGLPADYKLIYTYLAFFGIIADFGLFTIAVREMSQAKDQEEQQFIMGNLFGMRFFTILIAMVMASLFIFLIPTENYTMTVKFGVTIAAITTVLTMMASTTSSILQVHLRMTMPTIALALGKIVMAAYIITIIIFFQDIPYAFYHLIFAGITGAFMTFVITWHYTRKWFPFRTHFRFDYWKRIFKEALPYGAAIILSTMYYKMDILLLSFMRDKQEIAIYGYPSSIIEMLAIFPIYFMNSTLPTLSRAFAESSEKVKKIIQLSFNFIALITLPMVIGGVILSRPLMAFVMNQEFLTGNVAGYYGADIAFQLLLLPTIFAFVNTLFSFVLIASGKQAKLLKINLFGVLFNLITNLLFIPSYGFIAAGITTLLSEALVIWLTWKEMRKEITVHFEIKTPAKILFASVVMGLFVWWAQNSLHIVPLVGIGAMVFIATLIPLRVFDEKTMGLVKK